MRPTLPLLCLLGLATASFAQEVRDGSYWTNSDGSETCKVDVTDTGGTGVSVTYQDSTGFTSAVNGTAGPNSTTTTATASSAPAATTNSTPGNTYRIRNGKVQKKNADGTWSDLRKKKKSKSGGGFGDLHLNAGDPAPHAGTLFSRYNPPVFLQATQRAPWAGMLGSPGEEVVSLPAPE